MKVGTDAILLGAWIPLKNVKLALDIGTGCGILGLMLSQRAVPKLDAVELDELSAAEAKNNFFLLTMAPSASGLLQRYQAICC